MQKDLIILGGGPGGYTAALRAAELGAKVLLIEQDKVGGTCLHRGCIPTKAFYKNAEVMNTLEKAADFGLELSGYALKMEKVQARKKEIIERLHSGIHLLLKNQKVEFIKGQGRLISPNQVQVIEESGKVQDIQAKHILLATGSLSSIPPISGADLPGVTTSEEILDIEKIPERLVIIGGGVIGIEFASIFQAFGSQVTVLEFLPRILPLMDEEISKRLTPLLKKKGLKIETAVKVTEIVRETDASETDALTVLAKDKKDKDQSHPADLVLVATGRIPNTTGLGLEELGVKYTKQGIKVDENYATSVPGIYAIGDVIGGQMLAHVASYQGVVVAENLYGSPRAKVSSVVPSCVFSFPEVASVGLTEQEIKQQDIPYVVSKALFGANGKALTLGEGEGLVKVLAQKDDQKILGVHILGPHASDLIHEAALAVQKQMSTVDIANMIHAHPTLAESFQEAALKI
ncbi:MAG: dihydrolipoyl dehydrogenase [Peptococcaceae bacterium]|jgi:dihydrolipoamide dehydrogenase|nr:dihydrolipoyl dehydrogenase [Peptococcaceae bacterium]